MTPVRVAEVAARYLRLDRAVTVMSTPSTTIEGLGWLAGLAAIGGVLLVGGVYLRQRKARGGQ